VIDHLDTTNLGEADPLIMGNAESALRKGEGVIPVLALETRKARGFCMFSHTAKEGIECQINAYCNILQDLGMNSSQGRTFLFQDGKRVLLLKTGERDTIPFIGGLTHLQQVVIEPKTLFKGFVELLFLFLGWKQSVLKHFQHIRTIVQTQQGFKRGTALPLPQIRKAAFIPMLERQGLSAAEVGKRYEEKPSFVYYPNEYPLE